MSSVVAQILKTCVYKVYKKEDMREGSGRNGRSAGAMNEMRRTFDAYVNIMRITALNFLIFTNRWSIITG